MTCQKRQRLSVAFLLLQLVVPGLNQTDGSAAIMVNDSVSGDPFFTVPLLVPPTQLKQLNISSLSLCYEVLGTAGMYFNLITDECTSVNAHYHAINSFLNSIDQIAIQAVDTNSVCHSIFITLPLCTAHVDSVMVEGSYATSGISVSKYSDSLVHIVVPNCEELPLSMWVECKECAMDDPALGRDQFREEAMTFIVRRHLSFGHRKVHGLIGQFWNIPMSVEPIIPHTMNHTNESSTHTVSFSSAALRQTKTLTGVLHPTSWFQQQNCLYVGGAQASSAQIHTDLPNDPVIEGNYRDYQIDEAFSEEGYVFGQFNEDRCSTRTATTTTQVETSTVTEAARDETQRVSSNGMIVILATTLGSISLVVIAMAIIILCLARKVSTTRKQVSKWSNEMNQSDEIYDDVLHHHPQRQQVTTLSRNVAYSHESRESNKSKNHVYDEIHEQMITMKREEMKIVGTKVTLHTGMTTTELVDV